MLSLRGGGDITLFPPPVIDESHETTDIGVREIVDEFMIEVDKEHKSLYIFLKLSKGLHTMRSRDIIFD